jgi:hypothetical protein
LIGREGIMWAAMCVIPPFNGTHADLGDKAHEGAARALLPQDVLGASLN